MTQSDLFTEPMPAELADNLATARAELRQIANDVDAFLETFFEEVWQHANPDFNLFDRKTHDYERKIAKIRWLLWEIADASSAPTYGPTVHEGRLADKLRPEDLAVIAAHTKTGDVVDPGLAPMDAALPLAGPSLNGVLDAATAAAEDFEHGVTRTQDAPSTAQADLHAASSCTEANTLATANDISSGADHAASLHGVPHPAPEGVSRRKAGA